MDSYAGCQGCNRKFRKVDNGTLNSRYVMRISQINVYPVKSLKGLSVPESVVAPKGLELDRRWIIVDANGKFLTQRELPRMATIEVARRGPGIDVWTAEATAMSIHPIA